MPTLYSVFEPVSEKSGTLILVTVAPVPVIGMALFPMYDEQVELAEGPASTQNWFLKAENPYHEMNWPFAFLLKLSNVAFAA